MKKWTSFALAEGTAKALSVITQRIVGMQALTSGFMGGLLATMIIGFVQGLFGLVCALLMRRSLKLGGKEFTGAILFALQASIITVLGIWALSFPGAQIGISTFVALTIVVWGAVLDWIFNGVRLGARQWVGVAIFITAGVAVSDFAILQHGLSAPPVWILLLLLMALVGSAGEVISKAAGRRADDVLVFNAYVGGATSVCMATVATIAYLLGAPLPQLNNTFIFGSIAIGVIVFVMIVSKVLSYVHEGDIAVKTLVVYGSYLTLAIVAGDILTRTGWSAFNEYISFGKVLAIVLFVLAYCIFDQNIWERMCARSDNFSKRR